MRCVLSVGLAAVLATAIAGAAFAETGSQTTRTPVGDRDDQIIITGCVMRGIENNTQGPRSMLVWSKGDVYLETATTQFKSSDTIDKAILPSLSRLLDGVLDSAALARPGVDAEEHSAGLRRTARQVDQLSRLVALVAPHQRAARNISA